jgi:hypothetical protein
MDDMFAGAAKKHLCAPRQRGILLADIRVRLRCSIGSTQVDTLRSCCCMPRNADGRLRAFFGADLCCGADGGRGYSVVL